MNLLKKMKGSARGLFCSALAVVLLLYIGIAAYLYVEQDKLVFPGAATDERDTLRLLQEDPGSRITYRIDNATLHGWHFNAASGNTLLFYYGGNADDVSHAALPWAAQHDIASVFVNYRGYAGNTGTPSEAALYRDALTIFDDQVRRGQPGKNVVVIGRSLGTGVATYVAAHRHVDALVLVTPFDSLVAVGQHRYPFVPVAWMIRSHFDSLLRADKLTMPTLVLMAENDSTVPHENTQHLLQKLPALREVKTLAGTTHGNIVDSAEYLPTVTAFLHGVVSGSANQENHLALRTENAPLSALQFVGGI